LGNAARIQRRSKLFFYDGKYLIKTPFVPTVITVATEEFGKVCSNVNQSNFRASYLRIRPLNLLR
jgi:hypothetical protein